MPTRLPMNSGALRANFWDNSGVWLVNKIIVCAVNLVEYAKSFGLDGLIQVNTGNSRGTFADAD